MKFCSKCKQEKPTNEFHKDKNSKDELTIWCKNCRKIYDKNRIPKSEKGKRETKFKYDLTFNQWQDLFNMQNGCCAICGKHQSKLKRRLDADHNHKTKKVRGLLCSQCNTHLGIYEKQKIQFEKYLKFVSPKNMLKLYKKWIKEIQNEI